MSIAGFAVKNSVLVNMIMIMVFIVGIFSMSMIPKEEMPAVDFGNIIIVIAYPGVSPDEIETQIINKIEEEISDVENIKTLMSTAEEGQATISVEFEPDADIDKAWNDLNSELDKVNDLPEDALDPFVLRINMREVSPICDISLSGDFSGNSMREIAETVKDGILDISYISKTDVIGVRDREIWVEADAEKIENHGVTLDDLVEVISSRNMNIPGGTVKSGLSEFIVRTMGEFKDTEEIGRLLVRTDSNGRMIRVKDVATVNDTLAETTTMSRLNGEESVSLYVYKKAEGNVIDVMKDVRQYISEVVNSIDGLSAEIRNDTSKTVKSSIGTLSKSAMLGIVMVFLCLMFFLGWRNALFATWGIPFSFFMTFFLMHYFGMTMNDLSLFALVLVLGMIVDDAIVVIENVHRYMEMGMPAKEAAVKGTTEIMWPVISAVATTAAAFLPMLIMKGMMGKFMRVFPLVVSLALFASLVESLFILPSHMADLAKIPKKKKKEEHKFYNGMLKIYRKIIIAVLRRRVVSVLVVIAVMIVSLGILFTQIDFEFFPKRLPSTLILQVELPVGTNLDETDRIVTDFENFLLNMDEAEDYEAVISNIGTLTKGYDMQEKTNNAQIKVDLVEIDEMKHSHQVIEKKIRDYVLTVPQITTFRIEEPTDGPPTGKDVEIRIKGDNLDRLEYFGELVKTELKQIPGVTDIEDDFVPGKQEFRIYPHHDKIEMYGLNLGLIASTVRTACYGSDVTKFRGIGAEEYDIVVRMNKSYIEDIKNLKKLKLRTFSGEMIALKDVADFEVVYGRSSIKHWDKKRTITITANTTIFDNNGKMKKRTPSEVQAIIFGNRMKNIKGVFEDFSQKYPGYFIEAGGVAQEQRESYGSLYLAFIIAILVIYTILATQFKSYVQPLIVMTTVPFAFIGVIFGLWVTGLPFSLTTLVAFVALAGVVVNDSLVLVDFVNRLRDMGVDRWNSLIQAGMTRLRPIFLTTFTTIAGVMPMILSTSKSVEDWKPMAVSIAFGLFFATMLTLLVIPCIYSLVDSLFGCFGATRFKCHISFEEAMKKSSEE